MSEDEYPEIDEYGRRFYWSADYARGTHLRVYEPEEYEMDANESAMDKL